MAGSGRKNADAVLLLHLAGGASRAAAAKAAGVSERTVFRRLQDDAFRQQLAETRAEFVGNAAGALAAASTKAATTLHRLLDAESESVRLGAARAILELGTKLRESVEFEERLAALEAATRDDAEVTRWRA